jgi:hypothetical protein
VVAAVLITTLAILVGVGCTLQRLRLARGPYAGASWDYPRLCRACAEPVVAARPPAWLDQMITTPRVGEDRKARVHVALPGLLGGRAEALVIGYHTRTMAIVRVTGVRLPADLMTGSWVAGTMPLVRGGSQVTRAATVRARPGARHAITVWQHKARGPLHEPSEASQRALQAALCRCSWIGLNEIEIHDGAVCLAFYGLGSTRVGPTHISAIVEALEVGDGVNQVAS